MSLRISIFFTVIGTLAVAGCGRTDLELAGSAVQDGALGSGSGGRDGGIDTAGGRTASGGSGASGASAGSGGSGGRLAATGGVPGTGGTSGSGGSGTGGRPATGGASGTGGRIGTGGVSGTGGRAGTGGTAVDGGVRDATAERPVVDAAGPDLPPSTPGTLTCGTQICDTKTQSCCVSIAVGSVGAACLPQGSMCGGASLGCDEPADCASGTCCFGLQTGGGVGSQCVSRAACAGLARFVVCRTNADCVAPNRACCLTGVGVPICQPSCR